MVLPTSAGWFPLGRSCSSPVQSLDWPPGGACETHVRVPGASPEVEDGKTGHPVSLVSWKHVELFQSLARALVWTLAEFSDFTQSRFVASVSLLKSTDVGMGQLQILGSAQFFTLVTLKGSDKAHENPSCHRHRSLCCPLVWQMPAEQFQAPQQHCGRAAHQPAACGDPRPLG